MPNIDVSIGVDADGRLVKNAILKGKYKATESATKNSDGDCEVMFYIGKKIQVKIRGIETNNVKSV